MNLFKSFQIRIMLVLVLVIFSVLMIASNFMEKTLEQELEANVFSTNMNYALSMKKAVDLHAQSMVQTMMVLAEHREVRSFSKSGMEELLQSAVRHIPMISQMYITDKEGMQVYKTSFPESMGDRSDRLYFQRAIRGEVYFSDAIISRSSKKPICVIAVPIWNNEEVVGTLGASIELDYLEKIISEIDIEGSGYGYIVDRQGRVIAHPNKKFIEEMKDLSHLRPVQSVMLSEAGSDWYTFENTEKMVSYVHSESTQWGILVQRPSAEVFKILNEKEKDLRGFLSILFASVILFALPISKSISKPVNEILMILRNIANHNFDIVFYHDRDDEFGLIQKEIKAMSQELAVTHEELEQRVEDRTIELNESMKSLEKALEDLRQVQERLVVSERFAALHDMGIRISHEINTAIGNSIIAASYMERESKEAYQKLHEHTLTQSFLKAYIKTGVDSSASILKQLEQINSTVKHLKNSLEEVGFELVEIELLKELQEAVGMSDYHQIQAHVSMNIQCHESLTVHYYGAFIDQIIVELINNSVKYAFDENQEGHIQIKCSVPGNYIHIVYTDDGKGIPAEVAQRIFEPFHKSNMSNAGIGIGLSHLYNMIVNMAGGQITCHNNRQKGLEFEIYLPLKSNKAKDLEQ